MASLSPNTKIIITAKTHHTSTSSTQLNNGFTLTKQKDHHSKTHHTSTSSTQVKYQYVLKKSNAIPYIKKKKTKTQITFLSLASQDDL